MELARNQFELIAPLCHLGTNVVSPRSIYCRLAQAELYGTRSTIEPIQSILPRPDIVIYLRLDAQEAAQRVRARGHDLNSSEYLANFQDRIEEVLADTPHLRIDASQPVDAVQRELRDYVSQHFERNAP